MKRTLKNSHISQKNLKNTNYDNETNINILKKNLQQKNKTQTNSAISKNMFQKDSQKTTCSLISFFFKNQSDKEPLTQINKQNSNNNIHRLKYKSLDSASFECCKMSKSYNMAKKTNSYISKQEFYQNPLKAQLFRNSSKFNDPQKNETTLIYAENSQFQNKQYQKLELQYNKQHQNKKTVKDEIELSQKLFSSYSICQQKNKLYKQIAQARNRKYSYENDGVIQKNNLININAINQRQLSFRQNKNSIYSTIHSVSGEYNQTYINEPSYTYSFGNRNCYESINLYLNKENAYKYQSLESKQNNHNENLNESDNFINQSIIHKLDDYIVDKKKVGKIDRNKQFIRKSKKDIQILPETDTCIHNLKDQMNAHQNFNQNINKKEKIDSKESIQPLKRRTRFTSLNQCGYTIVSKYNKSEDRKSIMQESNIVFQASKHVKQNQNDNQVSSNFDQRIDSEVFNQRNCSSYIQNQIQSSNKHLQNENFVKQKIRHNFIRGTKRNSNKKEEFQLLNKYIKDEQLSIRFDLNLYQNQCNSQQ